MCKWPSWSLACFLIGVSENEISEVIDVTLAELLNPHPLDAVGDKRSDMVGQELDIVLNVEPLLLIAFEADPVDDGDIYIDVIRGLDSNDIRDGVGGDPEIDVLQEVIRVLGLAS